MEADNLSEDSGYVNRGLDIGRIRIEGSRIRLGSSDDMDRIDVVNDDTNPTDGSVNQTRTVSDEYKARSRNKETERRQRREERQRRLPVATQEELAALKSQPEKDACTLPVCCNNIKVFCVFHQCNISSSWRLIKIHSWDSTKFGEKVIPSTNWNRNSFLESRKSDLLLHFCSLLSLETAWTKCLLSPQDHFLQPLGA